MNNSAYLVISGRGIYNVKDVSSIEISSNYSSLVTINFTNGAPIRLVGKESLSYAYTMKEALNQLKS